MGWINIKWIKLSLWGYKHFGLKELADGVVKSSVNMKHPSGKLLWLMMG